MSIPQTRVALVSIGIGRVQRGFERFVTGLFETVHGHIDITLYRSGRPSRPGEAVPPFLRPATRFMHYLPLRDSYHRDCIAYAITLFSDLLVKNYDVIHCIDPPLAVTLQHLRRVFRLRSRLLFTNGCVVPLSYYQRFDHVHEISQAHCDSARSAGISGSHLTLIPLGLHAEEFRSPSSQRELRRKYGLRDSTFVILAVSAVKRTHKRIDYLIEEVSRIEGDILLWIDGNPEDASLPELARQKLGARCRITHVSTRELPELYRLADLFVHAALEEAFGLAIVEALSSGLMVVVHDSPHFEWLTGSRNYLTDMRVSGGLASRIHYVASHRDEFAVDAPARTRDIDRRFDWRMLAATYVEMYEKVAALARSRAHPELEVGYGQRL